MRPEERIATRWIKRLGLVHPVDIEQVLRKFADVYEDVFPIDAEAILIHQKQGAASRPKVIVARGMSKNRRTFTLAHELGHLLIPWHAGDFVCKPSDINDLDAFIQDMEYREIESQANRFAAEFIMPSELFLQEFLNGGLEAVSRYISIGNISYQAALIKLINIAPPGHVFVYTEGNVVKYSRRSRDTFVEALSPGEAIDLTRYVSVGAKVQEFQAGGARTFWVDLSNPVAPKELSDRYFETWQDVLQEILKDLGYQGDAAKKKTMSISGFFGAAISKVKGMANADYYSVAKIRFSENQFIQDIVQHELFDYFLDMRCEAARKRHKKS
ncbi:ImmA/IrrE family metallo-endopeptidase [Coraliomargarita sp. W4R53]